MWIPASNIYTTPRMAFTYTIWIYSDAGLSSLHRHCMPQPAPKWTWREVWHMIHIVTLRIQPYAALAQRLHLSTKCSRGVAGRLSGQGFQFFVRLWRNLRDLREEIFQTLLHLPTLKGPVGPKTGQILGLQRARVQTYYTAVHIYFVMFCLCNFLMALHTLLVTFKMLLNL